VKKLIAVVDDELDILQLVTFHLQKAGYRTNAFSDPTPFLESLKKERPDLIILDLMLPDIDGIEICKMLKQNSTYAVIPIIILTARTEEFDRVLGLEIGADDYVTKPFSPRELMARVKAVLRRSHRSAEHEELHIGARLHINRQKHAVTIDAEPVNLTATEFKLLSILAEKPGHVFSRQQLLDQLWGEDKIVIARTIDVHIKNLRTKLGAYGSNIKNVRGFGYKLDT